MWEIEIGNNAIDNIADAGHQLSPGDFKTASAIKAASTKSPIRRKTWEAQLKQEKKGHGSYVKKTYIFWPFLNLSLPTFNL